MDAPTKKRGRPPKVEEEELVEEATEAVVEPELVEPSQIVDLKHVIRTISYDGTFREEGAQPASVVEDYLRQNYFAQGYVLYSVEHVQVISTEGAPFASQMLYVLVKYAE